MMAMGKQNSTTAEPLVVERLVKRFGDLTAVNDVSLAVGPGECLGLLGPNGAGKSTLIRSIVGRVIPDSGSVAVFGAAAASTEARMALGWVPQELAIYPRISCTENLGAFGRYYGLKGLGLEEAIKWCLHWAALEDRAGELAKNLSGGMKRRLNMAAGMLHRPQRGAVRRADGGRGSAVAEPDLRNDRSAARCGSGDCVHHALHGRGGAAVRPDRDYRSRKDYCEGTKEELVRNERLEDAARCWRGLRETRMLLMPGPRATADAWWRRRRSSRGAGNGDCAAAGRCDEGAIGAGGCVAAAAKPGKRVSAPDRKGVTRLILHIARTALIALKRDRGALVLSFVLPLAFFSIFAVIFGGQHDTTPKVHVIVVDEDKSEASQDLVKAMEKESSLVVATAPAAKSKNAPQPADYTEATAEKAVQAGDAPVALIVPKGFGQHPIAFGPDAEGSAVELLNDQSDTIAPQMVMGLLQKDAMTAMPAVMAEEGMKYGREVHRRVYAAAEEGCRRRAGGFAQKSGERRNRKRNHERIG